MKKPVFNVADVENALSYITINYCLIMLLSSIRRSNLHNLEHLHALLESCADRITVLNMSLKAVFLFPVCFVHKLLFKRNTLFIGFVN